MLSPSSSTSPLLHLSQPSDFAKSLLQSAKLKRVLIACLTLLLAGAGIALYRRQRMVATPPSLPLFVGPATDDQIASMMMHIVYNKPSDLMQLTQWLRILKRLRARKAQLSARETALMALLDSQLFPWPSSAKREELVVRHRRGIVICTGQIMFPLAVHAIRTIRFLDCALPIEVFYMGEQDLNRKSVAYLDRLDGVRTVDLARIFDLDQLKLETWDIKPFAMLASSFREIILMDADTVFVQNPTVMLDYPEYAATGALFFIDRTFGVQRASKTDWINSFLPPPLSEKLKASEFYKNKSHYRQEAGVVVIDRERHQLGMLATCRLNYGTDRDRIRKFTHGEKETYWIGFEMVEEPYEFVDDHAGHIGGERLPEGQRGHFNGKLAHFDRNSTLLWFNDGIVVHKHDLRSGVANLQYISNEGTWDMSRLVTDKVRRIPESQLALLEQIEALWTPNLAV